MKKIFSDFFKIRNNVALETESKIKFTYGQIIIFLKTINKNIKKKSLVLIISDNTLASISGYASLMISGNVIILVDKNFKLDFIKKTIEKFKPNYIYAPLIFFNKLEGLLDKKIQLDDYRLFGTKNKKIVEMDFKNKLLLATSGTTQSPKFVRLSNENIYYNTKNIIQYLKISSKHIALTTMPMAYSYGLSIINTHLEAGAKIIISKTTIFEKKFWSMLNNFKIRSLGGVPDFYEMLKKLKFEKFELPHLKYITQAGGKLSKDLAEYIQKNLTRKFKFYIMYGQTEASPRISYLPWKHFKHKPASIGKALKGSRIELIDEKKKKITKEKKIGEIVFYGKNVCLGYAKNFNDLKKGDENKSKLFTGDLAYRDKDGFFYIVGRKNKISKIFGLRVDLEQIERFIKLKGFIIYCVPDNKYLIIEITNNISLEQTETIKKEVNNYTGINKNYIIFKKTNFKKQKNIFKEIF